MTAITTKPSQPLKWHGGKSYSATWLQSLAPADGYTHRNHVFAGGLGEFWTWPHECVAECVNDLDGRLANFYRVLRDPELFSAFRVMVELTPLSRETFEDAREYDGDDQIVQAWAFFTQYRQSRQGLGRDYSTPTKRLRRGINEQCSAWLSAVDGLDACHERLAVVEIENLDAVEFVRRRDHGRAFFYLDPPYVASTRSSGGEYGAHEMSDDQHVELLETLAAIEGRFMLSGYRSRLYDDWADRHGFHRFDREIDNKASSSRQKAKRVECVWMNYSPANGGG